jgi:hypothetical protein
MRFSVENCSRGISSHTQMISSLVSKCAQSNALFMGEIIENMDGSKFGKYL